MNTQAASESAGLPVVIVLCTFNGMAYLDAQLDSLLAQTRRADLLVISDDGSNDGTQDRLKARVPEFEAQGTRVALQLNSENLGYIRNFEQAFLRAGRNALIFPCDQDDVWYPEKVETFVRAFEQDPSLDVLHSDARLTGTDGTPTGKRLLEVLELTPLELKDMQTGDAFKVLLKRNVVTGAAMAFRSRVLEEALPFPAEWSHDEWLALIASFNGKVRTRNEVTLDYRQHGNNQIGVRERGLGHKLTGRAGYRAAFLQRLVQRYDVLAAHLARLPPQNPARLADLQERRTHAANRNLEGASRLRRLRVVSQEYLSGRYHRFGKGLRSALVDALGVD